jgi:hypothetical protein
MFLFLNPKFLSLCIYYEFLKGIRVIMLSLESHQFIILWDKIQIMN